MISGLFSLDTKEKEIENKRMLSLASGAGTKNCWRIPNIELDKEL
jgi:hypothetical protein